MSAPTVLHKAVKIFNKVHIDAHRNRKIRYNRNETQRIIIKFKYAPTFENQGVFYLLFLFANLHP